MDHLSRRSFNIALASLVGSAMAAPSASAQATWPGARAVTLVVPFPPGGAPDAMARALAQEFSEKTGGRFVADNRAGASGNIGASAVARSAPDGYTFLMATNGPGAINKLIFKEIQYDPEKDFVPVIYASALPAIVAAGPKATFKNFAELVAYAKANPKKVTFGSPGTGTLGHIIAVLLQKEAGIEMTHVPYKGSGPLATDLLGGHVDLAFDLLATYAPMLGDGKVTGIALAAAARNEAAPNVPTAKELGINGLESAGWCVLLAPKGTPADVIAKLNALTNDYLKTDKAKAYLKTLGMTPVGGTPQEAATFVAAEFKKWTPVIKEANITVE